MKKLLNLIPLFTILPTSIVGYVAVVFFHNSLGAISILASFIIFFIYSLLVLLNIIK